MMMAAAVIVGLVAAGRLFEGLAQVLFVELLRADLP